jgi:hypothetical protein
MIAAITSSIQPSFVITLILDSICKLSWPRFLIAAANIPPILGGLLKLAEGYG